MRRDERGAVLVVTAITMLALLAVAAIVVDLAAVRSDRSSNQVTADAAAAAAAVAGAEGTSQDGCLAAVGYAEEHLGTSLGISCATLPLTCTNTTAPVSTSGTVDGITVTITYPVPDASPLMTSSSVGATTQTIVTGDAGACDRFGVEVVEDRPTFFAGIVGTDAQTTAVHSVAIANNPAGDARAVNVLLLERTDCPAISMSGSGGGTGGISVGSVVDPATGDIFPGLLAVDSDGSGAGCSTDGTIDVNGTNSLILANGPTGCPGEVAPIGAGNGCGEIQSFAPGGAGCVLAACSSSGTVLPAPTQTSNRLTRAPIDWRFNCKVSYPAAYAIAGCPNTTTNSPYIDGLVADAASGRPAGFSDYEAAGYDCTISGPPSTVVTIPEGNWYVGCDLDVGRTLTFTGGNVVFGGNVSVQSSGVLSFNTGPTASYSWFPPTPTDHLEYSAGAAYIYFQSGSFTKTGQASVTMNSTMLYLSSTSSISMGGGSSGTLIWSAPTEGPFEDLAMWSEGTANHGFAGQSSLTLNGVFFAPVANISYSGNGVQQQVAAQFISETLSVSGQGQLIVTPVFDRSVLFPESVSSTIIR